MLAKLVLNMWCILILCSLLVVGAQTLTIDSQLGTSVEDCFERISIGEQLPPDAIYRNVSELTTRECEQICKQDIQCQAYDYGVGAKGNATCNLSKLGEKDIKEKNALLRHPDYDVYVRRVQCEQGPPKPLQTVQDEVPGPEHRPVIRPEADDSRKPLLDEFLSDLRPENMRPYPPLRPYNPPQSNHVDKPDDYNSQGLDFDGPPSYGLHRPQDIPYRPSSVPSRPLGLINYSDPYDILQFQNGRPPHISWRPDPYYPPHPYDDIPDIYGPQPVRPLKPYLSSYRPEQPEFVYINRPNRKPSRPQDDFGGPGYGNSPTKPLEYPTKPNPYEDPRPSYKPNKPIEYQLYRPIKRPSYDYNSQYASNYGQSQYNDNPIYIEIYDPPRPYRPSKPYNDMSTFSNMGAYGSNYGYGAQNDFSNVYGGQNSYSQNSQSNYYGAITQLDSHNRPQNNRPYFTPNSGYGVQNSKPEKPYDRPTNSYLASAQDYIKPEKPGYGSIDSIIPSQNAGYGSQSTGYGSTQSSVSSPGYGSTQNSSPNPNTGYGSSQSSNYGSTQSSQSSNYGQTSNNYGTQSTGNEPNHKPQDIPKPVYSERPSYSGSYGGQTSYGGQNDYSSQSYGGSYQDYSPSYGNQLYGNYLGSYGHRPVKDKPYDNRPSYIERPQYENQASYGTKPINDKPSYENRPSDDRPVYGEKPIKDRPIYQKPDYNYEPGYGQRPINDRPENMPNYDNTPSYDNNRPDGEPGPDFESEGYKNNIRNATKFEVKPVYEYEGEKPNAPSYIVKPSGEVITSRPVAIGDYGGRPAGREPVLSYKEWAYS